MTQQILEELNVKELEFVNEEFADDKSGFVSAKDGDCWIALPTDISAELQAEGMAREIVRRLQTMRRSDGLELIDHITVYYQGEPAVQQVMRQFAGYIKQETLALELIPEIPPENAYTEKHRLMNSELLLGIKKAA